MKTNILIILMLLLFSISCFGQPDINCYSQTKIDSMQVIIDSLAADNRWRLNKIVEQNQTMHIYKDSVMELKDTIEGLRFVNEILRNDTARNSVVMDSVTYLIAFSDESKIIDVTNTTNLVRIQLLNDCIKMWLRKEDELVLFLDLGVLNIFSFIN